jgi:hypothetical protein
MAGLIRMSGVVQPCEPEMATLTVLQACEMIGNDSIPHPVEMTKRFYLGANGELRKTSYPDAIFFDAFRVHVDGIRPMGGLLHQIANAKQRNIAIIRGIGSEGALASVKRNDPQFPEHPDGTDWVMLDIDNVPAPPGITPYSLAAIVWLVANKLPVEFRDVTCYYQFSSSAGVCDANGKLLKSGLCAHLFFFLDRRVPGKMLAAYLRQECLTSGFYTIDNNKGGVATLTYGIDPAPIRSAVQLHYVANPIVGKGVVCLLANKDRDGFINGARDTVQVPELAGNIIATTDLEQNRTLSAWKDAHGYKKAISQVHTANGIATTTYYKPTQEGVIGTGRVMTGVKMSTWKTADDVCTLVLEQENSPGSWYVLKVTPNIARRRDGTTIPLKEFSESAYAYVRDELQWFFENPYRSCSLLADGHLPAIDSFARARHSLILAPTGSGKTFQMTTWMAAKSSSTFVIYVAQTIPLVNQMAADLAANNTSYHHYQGFNYFFTPRTGIFLTTNESLPKILDALEMTRYVLVVDELHRALDDFARDGRRFNNFKNAITQAQRVVYMTGTLTAIQRNMLSEIVGGILGRRLTETDYCCYEFQSVKQNPLHIRHLKYFQSDVIGLFKRYAELNGEGQSIPQTVLIMNTSKMETFIQIFASYGLTEQVEVVSRPENTPDEIETARTTTRPILVASPLFSIGLNFECEPEVLWCRFDRLDADTSQINQTINRANRHEVACSVRIYADYIDERPFVFPLKQSVRDSLEAMIEDESVLSNPGFDMPMMLDRVTYNEYRKIEKNVYKSLGTLINDDAFQNYVVEELIGAPERDQEMHEEYREFFEAAQAEYDNRVLEWCSSIGSNRPIMMLLDDAQRLAEERRNNFKSDSPRTEREIEDEELAIIMAICRLEHPVHARKVEIAKLKRLFGVREPWLSDRLNTQNYRGSKKVSAGKLGELIHLIETLGELAAGKIDGRSLAVKLNQDKKLQRGFLALATGEKDYVAMQKSFDKLENLKAIDRSTRSVDSKRKAEGFAVKLLLELLKEIGIFFKLEADERGKWHLNLAKPIVSPTWDFAAMVNQLNLFVELLKVFPDDQPLVWGAPQNYIYSDILTCVGCKSFYLGRCLRGNAVDFTEWGIEENLEISGLWDECQTFAPRRNN